MFSILKLAITTFLVIGVSEVSKRSSFWAGLLAALPIVSYLGLIWLYVETGSTTKVADFCTSVFWLVIPSLPFFLLLPILLKQGYGFVLSLIVATLVMLIAYGGVVMTLKRFGVML